ncbi:transposase [Oceanobacillus oncorhynchi]|uniref:transposase n=1 Tax=Oceanobacillus oncorhynchi TaxID=545501 RepID=UPI0039AED60A
MRMDNQNLKRYSRQVVSGQDQTFEITFNRVQTNYYRQDKPFRTKLMNTTYTLRFVKIPLTKAETGEVYDEVLLTNLTPDEFSLEGLRELYRLRWEVETVYNILKNRMKLEEFSGIRDRLILQDIYCCVWLYNLTMIHLMEVNEAYEIPQDRYKYEMKRNINIAIGIIKTYFIQSVMSETREARKKSMDQMNTLILKHLVPIRPNRQAKRQNSVNKSRRSYRYTY